MRLRQIRLHPFAGFSDKEIAFSPGLNIILGANDLGKSSIFRAIDAALFLSSKVSKTTKEGRELSRLFPFGSDHAQVSLELEKNNARYRMEKSWGSGASVSFEGNSGQRLLQDEKVEESLRALLPVPASTYQSVLFMGQGALEGTVAALAEKRDSLHSLGDFLRVAVDKSAGVSVESLKNTLKLKIEKSFSCWDRKSGLPEKGRGIENPWLKNVGAVLAAYYAKEKIEQEARIAQSLEAERDKKNLALSESRLRLEAARSFVAENQKIVESASQRQILEARLAKVRMESEAILHDLNAWMQAESDIRNFSPEVERLNARRFLLEEELKNALAQTKQREALQRFEKARALKLKLDTARQLLLQLPAVTTENLKHVRMAQQEVDSIKTGLKAGKIQLQFTVKKDLELTVKKDLDSERKGQMTPQSKPMSITAGGKVQLSSEYFELIVSSGDGKFHELEEGLRRKNDFLGKLLNQLNAQSLEDAQEKHEKFQDAVNAVKNAEAIFNGALRAGEKIEDMERSSAVIDASALAREAEIVSAELRLTVNDWTGKNNSLVKAESLLKELVRRHAVNSSALLLERMADKKNENTLLEKQLVSLPALPENMGSLETFLERYNSMKAEADRVSEVIFLISAELAELKGQMPEQSAQDLERGAIEAAAAFEQELAHGKALLRVDEAILKLESSEQDVYFGFQEEFTKQVKELSAGKYLQTSMKESIPAAFQRLDGALIPYAWLSAGTKDAFALALRLSMASYFLGKSEGFLMIDDPMVNMDPARQKIAAKMLRDFSDKKQVILFTCHPSHAELLGGNLIQLS